MTWEKGSCMSIWPYTQKNPVKKTVFTAHKKYERDRAIDRRQKTLNITKVTLPEQTVRKKTSRTRI
jgi:hypothetical protein